MTRFIFSSAILALLVGCSTPATWQHPARAGDGHDGATMALAACESYASGTGPAPMPTSRMEVPAPTSYTTVGTYSQYGSSGTLNATTTPNSGFASKYASGSNAAADLIDAFESARYRKRIGTITQACMRTQGWIDTSTPEGQTKFKQDSEKRLANSSASKLAAEKKAAADEWSTVIGAFMEIEARSPQGIDYRNDPKRLEALDKYVKQLANDPKNDKQNMAWFLIEAHKLVLAEER